jgi:hypothetical protein
MFAALAWNYMYGSIFDPMLHPFVAVPLAIAAMGLPIWWLNVAWDDIDRRKAKKEEKFNPFKDVIILENGQIIPKDEYDSYLERKGKPFPHSPEAQAYLDKKYGQNQAGYEYPF